MNVYNQKEMLDLTLGEVGTQERDEYERQVAEYLEQINDKVED